MSTPPVPMSYLWPGIIASQAIHVAAKLRIPDLLASGPRTAAELAADCGAHPAALESLLRGLATLEMFAATSGGRFENTPLSDILRTDHPQSHRDSALFLPEPFLWRPLGELYESVRTGEPSFERIFGQRFFEYLASHPADAGIFNAAMTHGSAAFTAPALLAAYDFSRFEKLVDVGGGEGALLGAILEATPALRGILFDLPGVAGPANIAGSAAARCEIVSGSFFESVPEGADAYLLARVIHDWRDDDALKILRTVRRAIRPGGTLLLLESPVDSPGRSAGLMELLMLVVGGRERSEAEFRALLTAADFTLNRIVPAGISSVLECGTA